MNLTSPFFAALLTGVSVAGCSSAHAWEQEYACTGQEQSSAYFVGSDPASAMQREYPLTIDFHLRSGTVMVKSTLATVDAFDNEGLRFSAKNKSFWMNGQFDKRNGKLTVVDERPLEIAGRTQLVRTSGQYVCKK